jgi:hypothetical protein
MIWTGMGRARRVFRNWTTCWCTQLEIQRLITAIEGWLELHHDNLLPIFGMTLGFGPLPALVCPWMENGTLTRYLEHNHHQITASTRKAMVSGHHTCHNCWPIYGIYSSWKSFPQFFIVRTDLSFIAHAKLSFCDSAWPWRHPRKSFWGTDHLILLGDTNTWI